MNVMEDCAVREEEVHRIIGEIVAAVVIHGLSGREREEQHCLAGGESSNVLPDESPA